MFMLVKCNSNKGFTLVELIVVIVVIGILAVAAAPRFIDMSSEARAATVDTLHSALETGSRLVYAKALINGQTSGTSTLDIDNDGNGDMAIRSGFPRVRNSCSDFVGELEYWLNLTIEASCTSSSAESDWFGVVDNNAFHFFPSGFSSAAENCYVTYTTASVFDSDSNTWLDTDSAEIEKQTSGC